MTKYGTPAEVKFCARCVISNQRPSSVVERDAKPTDPKPTIAFDENGVCSACRYADMKKSIDWQAREQKLIELLEQQPGRMCIVPGSGGKDSMFAAHVLKHKYGAHVITVTAAPLLYTDIGRRNFDAWTRIATNILFTPHNYRERTREAFFTFLHPFKGFIEEQRAVGPRLSSMTGIPLVFYGECPAERGNDIRENDSPVMDPRFYPQGAPHTEVHYLGWYLNWNSQANFYYAVDNCNFEPNEERTQGSYSKMSSIDDKLDVLHYWTTLQKFGIGRATYNACEDIRDGYMTREEGVALVKKYDQEPPTKHLDDCLAFMGITRAEFDARCAAGRPDHLWDGDQLRHAVWMENA